GRAGPLALQFNDEVAPGSQGIEAVEPAQARLLGVKDGLGGEADHRPHERLLVSEVVVELRAAHAGRRTYVFGGGAGHTLLEHELRRRGHDPVPGGLTLAGPPSGPRGSVVASHHFRLANFWS